MKTQKRPVVEEIFGHELVDNYRWLENAKDPEVLKWVADENQRTDEWFDEKMLEKKIGELKAAEPARTFTSLERCEDGYIAVTSKGGFHAIVHLDKNMENEEPILKRYDIEHITPFGAALSECNDRYIAIQAMKDGDNKGTYLVMDRITKQVIEQRDSAWSGVWSANHLNFYIGHAYYDEETKLTTLKVVCYDILNGKETTVYEECGTAGIAMLYCAQDKEHIIVELWDDFSNWRYVAIEENTGKIHVINSDAEEIHYIGTKAGTHYFISKSQFEMGALIAVDKENTLAEARIVREGTADMLEGGFVLGDSIFLLAKRNVASVLIKIEGDRETKIALPDAIGTASLLSCSQKEATMTFESFTRPASILKFDGENFEMLFETEEKRYEDLVVEQKWAPSKGDEEMIPYFFVHRKDVPRDGSNPTIIYAYGGYNASMTPWYRDMVTGIVIGDWVEQGGIYVLANIRGGNEFGAKWHKDGMQMKKRNCYDDFIGVTEQLIQDGWTKPEKIGIDGCSNGGLLMSVLVTMRPDLFGCVIDSVPHTDMIRFTRDDNGPRYIQEYGNPLESKEMFEYMLSYSPYHNVREVEYPATYIQTGECDNNVPPYHGKKFAALMQEKNRSCNPILLRVLAEGAHDRGSGEAYWKTIAEMRLFIEKALK
ncbi:prolyl oligopeptidase family serine peptidase [Roseburia hominis]